MANRSAVGSSATLRSGVKTLRFPSTFMEIEVLLSVFQTLADEPTALQFVIFLSNTHVRFVKPISVSNDAPRFCFGCFRAGKKVPGSKSKFNNLKPGTRDL